MPLDDKTIEQTARALIALRDAHGEGPAPAPPPDLASAYRIQFEIERILVSERGWQPIGWKIGATNPGSRAALKVAAPFLGRLYREMTSLTPTQLPATPGLYRAYEAEIVLEIGRDLGPKGAPYTAEAIRAATRAVAPAIEMVGGFLPPGLPNGGLALIADFAGHAHCVVGAATSEFAALDLMEAPIAFSIDGEQKAVGKGATVGGGPFGATAWLANALTALGRSLKAGKFVTTGTAIAPVPFAGDGKSAVADFGALGRVEVRIGEIVSSGPERAEQAGATDAPDPASALAGLPG
jgi:2-keto-4-pentenoate hydratase